MADPGERVFDELTRLVRRLTQLSVADAGDEGLAINNSQRLALIELANAGPLRLNDLAARMRTSAPTASRAVDALEALGLVVRTPDPSDRRAVQLDLTPIGRTRTVERKQRALEHFRPAAKALTASERAELAGLLARVASRLGA